MDGGYDLDSCDFKWVLFIAGMYKNQLQELAQRSCFNLPSYTCIREGPDHAPRFKASVNFNGEIFEGPSYCNTLRQAEHAAAEVALNTLSTRGPSRSLTARVLVSSLTNITTNNQVSLLSCMAHEIKDPCLFLFPLFSFYGL